MAGSSQKPIELILARNLMASLSTPAFLVDEDGVLIFYNEAAGAMLGKRFEEAGAMPPEEWGTAFGPMDEDGRPLPIDELPLVISLRHGLPAHHRFAIRSLDGTSHTIEVSAMPIVAQGGRRGAMAIFWPVEGAG
ncbi:MAG TPA: PAS domain-containing protein [Solirubrobacteraceae bacterium]|nr:PAS domain-containing protein [Solirubrobacteraceae bacterium]